MKRLILAVIVVVAAMGACTSGVPPEAIEMVGSVEQALVPYKIPNLFPCNYWADCPESLNECQYVECINHECRYPWQGDGTPCQEGEYPNHWCDNGRCVVPPPPSPECITDQVNINACPFCDDGNPCTVDMCEGDGMSEWCTHLYKGYGAACDTQTGYYCTATGWCCPSLPPW